MYRIDSILAATASIKVGAFRCPTGYPRFGNTGPAENHIVVFPRSAVWIRHIGARWFEADPGLVTIYNRGQEYQRAAISTDGDRSDWFGVSPDLAWEIARTLNPRAEDCPDRPFPHAFTGSDTGLYMWQRALFLRIQSRLVDPLELEQEVIDLVAAVIARAFGATAQEHPPTRRVQEAHRDLADRARAQLAGNVAAPTNVTELARHLDVSPFHLCRVFRAQTGTTLHRYRLELRLRIALERLGESSVSLSRLAYELGFASHSHFTTVMREWVGATPSAVRLALRRGRSPFPFL